MTLLNYSNIEFGEPSTNCVIKNVLKSRCNRGWNKKRSTSITDKIVLETVTKDSDTGVEESEKTTKEEDLRERISE